MRPCSTHWALSGCSPWADLTGLFLASLATDVHLSGTYFVVAHFHYVMVGGAVMAYLGGIHYLVAEDYWPALSGWLGPFCGIRDLHRFQSDFLPAISCSVTSECRGVIAVYPAEFQVLNVMSSAGASILGIGYLDPPNLL
jgi:cytochrome c oxidase subunit 1